MARLFVEVAKYAAVSAIALVVDAGLLLILTRYAGWQYMFAATISFLIGACIAYLLSVRFVFRTHRLRDGTLEFTGFVVIGLLGLGVNLLVLLIAVGHLGMDLKYAKAVAAGCTFLANFVLRRQLLFRTGAVLAIQR